jgi:hypothetical protein
LVFSGNPTVYTYTSASGYTAWTVIAGYNPEFTGQAVYECLVDEDIGTVTFGDYDPVALTGSGYRPAFGEYVAIQYSGCHWIAYEPEYAPDYYTGVDADTTVTYGESSNGFVHITKEVLEPISLVLTADLPSINSLVYGPLDIGKTFAKIVASVYGPGESILAGEQVIFEISEPSFGGFNGSTIATIPSDVNGRSIVYYTPPSTIDDFGYATDTYSVGSGITTITVANGSAPSEDDYVYLYTVAISDVTEGMPLSDLSDYYESYFIDELIDSDGVTFSGILGAETDYEINYRSNWSLPVPNTYNVGDIITGSKKIVMTYDANALDPYSGELGSYTALQPTSWITTISGVHFTYSGNLTLDSTDRSFYVVYPSNISIRARVYNDYYQRWIYSNTITINLNIPDSMSGLYFASDFASLPSGILKRQLDYSEYIDQRDTLINYIGGDETNDEFFDSTLQELYEQERIGDETTRQWFTRTYWTDSNYFGLSDVTVSPLIEASGVVPLGFRVTGASYTMASALDAATFYDVSGNVSSPHFVLVDDFKEAVGGLSDNYTDYSIHYSRMIYQDTSTYRKLWRLSDDTQGSYVQLYYFPGVWTTFTAAEWLSPASWLVWSAALGGELHFRAYSSSSVAFYKFAGFNADMPDHENFSNMTHIYFKARGSGTLTVSANVGGEVFRYDLTLQSTYQTYRIPFADFVSWVIPGRDWDDYKDRVQQIGFGVLDGNDIEVEIDNVVLEGRNIFDFVENN